MRKAAVAIGVSLLVGCGGGESAGGADGAAAFVGTYATNGTTSWSDCPAPPAPLSGPGVLTIALGPAGVTTTLNGCTLDWAVSGSVLSLVPGQSCSGTTTDASFVATWTGGSAIFTGDVAALSGVGGSELFSTAGGTETCLFTETGTWTKS